MIIFKGGVIICVSDTFYKKEWKMSELIIYKSNDLVVSRYDLTEQETRLISYAVAKLKKSSL